MSKVYGAAMVAALAGLSACMLDLDELGEARYANFTRSEPAGDEEGMDAEVSLRVGTLTITPGSPDRAYEVDLQYNERAFEPRLQFTRRQGRAHFEFELEGGKSVRRVGKTNLHVQFNPQKPLRLEARMGVGKCHIDLSGMKVESLLLESGVGEAGLTVLSPTGTVCDEARIRSGVGGTEVLGLGNLGFRTFRFQGGVGGSTLDFSGSWEHVGEVEIEVGVGGVEIRIPRDIGAEIHVSKSFLSGLEITGFRKEGNTYLSENLDRVAKVVRFRISAGIGGVEIRWI